VRRLGKKAQLLRPQGKRGGERLRLVRCRAERHDFLVKQLLERLAGDLVLLKVKLEEVGRERRSDRLVVRVVV
jgi:hypothetical protein